MKKLSIYLLSVLFLFSCFGCSSRKEPEKKDTVTEYLSEKELTLPEDSASCFDVRLDEDGTMYYLGQSLKSGSILWKSADQGKSWETALALPDELRNSFIVEAKFTDDGGIFFSALYDAFKQNQGNPVPRFYYVTENGDFQQKAIAADGKGFNDMFCSRDFVYGRDRDGVIHKYNYKTGELVRSFDKSSLFVNQFALSDNRVLAIGMDSVETYDSETGDVLDTDKTLAETFTGLAAKNESANSFFRAGKADTLLYVGNQGIFEYRSDKKETRQLLYGNNHPYADASGYLTNVSALPDGSIAVCYTDSGKKAHLVLYAYSEEGIEVAQSRRITLYSLEKSSSIQEIVDDFNASQDQIFVNYEFDITGDNAITKNDAINNLNLRLQAGTGPDLFLLDGLHTDAYLEKQILQDVTDVLEKEEILTNIALPFTKDGHIFAVPLYFDLMGIHGDKDIVAASGSLGELTDALRRLHKSAPGQTVLDRSETANYAEALLLSYSKEFLGDEQISMEKLRDFFENMKAIYDISSYGPSETTTDDTWDFSYTALSDNGIAESRLAMGEFQLTISGVTGVHQLARLESFAKEKIGLCHDFFRQDGDVIFAPRTVLAINSASSRKADAAAFLTYCISEDFYHDHSGGGEGFPVNKTALEKLLAMDLDATEEYLDQDENTVSFPLDSLSDKYQKRLLDDMEQTTAYAALAPAEREILLEYMGAYINGKDSLDACASAAAEKLNLFRQE